MRVILVIVLALFASKVFADNQYYAECSGCSEGMMKLKAASVPLVGAIGQAHVFNEKDKIYKRYNVYKETVTGPGMEFEPLETFVKTTASQISANQTIKQDFEQYIDAKRQIESSMEGISITLYANNVVQSNNIRELSVNSNSDDRCVSREVAPDEKTAHDYISSRSNREDLFAAINQEFDTTGVGNMPEFFAKHDKLFQSLSATGIPLASQLGASLSIIGANSNEIEVFTPDNGRKFVALDFSRKAATIELAFDGNCNEIPLDENAPMVGKYKFDTFTGVMNMEELLGSFGASFTGSYGFRCGQFTFACSLTSNSTKTCRRGCAYYVSDD